MALSYLHGWLPCTVVGRSGDDCRVRIDAGALGALDAVVSASCLATTQRAKPRGIVALEAGERGALAILSVTGDAGFTRPEDASVDTGKLQYALVNMGFKAGEVKCTLASMGERVQTQPMADTIKQALALLNR